MMKRFLLAIIITLATLSCGRSQQYFSKTYFYNESNLALGNMFLKGDSIIMSTNTFLDNVEIAGAFICDHEGNEINTILFPWMDSGSNALKKMKNGFIVSGHTLSSPRKIKLSRLNVNFDSLWTKTYTLDGIVHVNLDVVVLNNNYYLLNYDFFTQTTGGRKEMNLLGLNENGNIIFSKNYGLDHHIVDPWEMITFKDESLILTDNRWKIPGSICKKGRVTRVDSLGNTLWSTELNCSEWPGGSVYTCGLGDTTSLAVSYTYDYSDDISWTDFPYVPNLRILSEDGEITFDTSFITSEFVEPYILSLERGKGDYFFGLGYLWDWETFWNDDRGLHAWVFKMSNSGELLWSRRISNEDTPMGTHTLSNLLELENGDLFISGRIFIDNKALLWLVKTNSEGCVDEINCNEEQILTALEHVQLKSLSFDVFPNPASEVISIKTTESNNEISIINSNGDFVQSMEMPLNELKISIAHFTPGIYSIVVRGKNGGYGYKSISVF